MIDAFAYGFLISLVIVLYAHHEGALNTSGSFSALVTGTLMLGFGGWVGYIALMLFFIPTSLFPLSDSEEGGRSGRQVLGKSLIALFFAVLHYYLGDPLWLMFMIASLAASAADTWSSIIGRAYGGTTRILPTFKKVNKGTPGGVSLYGFLVALIASFVFALYHFIVFNSLLSIVIIWVIGTLNTLIDSLLNSLRHKEASKAPMKWCSFIDSAFMNFLSNALSMLVLFGLVVWLL